MLVHAGQVIGSVLDRPQLVERLKNAANALSERYPEIELIVLFDSLARGDAVPGSDADLLIVVSRSAEPFLNGWCAIDQWM